MQKQDGAERKAVRERHQEILRRLQEAGSVSVIGLADDLQTSRETIRRDLTYLAEKGQVRKVHGGAVTLQSGTEDPFLARMEQNIEAKRKIARKAAALFKQGDSLLVDSGSTTVVFAEELSRISGLTIITNSQLVAQAATRSDRGNRILLLGGEYHAEGAETLGAVTNDQINQLHADHAVLTVGALNAAGECMDFVPDAALTARSMIARARYVTILIDSSKFDRQALYKMCSADEVTRLVTDEMPSPQLRTALEAAGVEIILAKEADTA